MAILSGDHGRRSILYTLLIRSLPFRKLNLCLSGSRNALSLALLSLSFSLLPSLSLPLSCPHARKKSISLLLSLLFLLGVGSRPPPPHSAISVLPDVKTISYRSDGFRTEEETPFFFSSCRSGLRLIHYARQETVELRGGTEATVWHGCMVHGLVQITLQVV